MSCFCELLLFFPYLSPSSLSHLSPCSSPHLTLSLPSPRLSLSSLPSPYLSLIPSPHPVPHLTSSFPSPHLSPISHLTLSLTSSHPVPSLILLHPIPSLISLHPIPSLISHPFPHFTSPHLPHLSISSFPIPPSPPITIPPFSILSPLYSLQTSMTWWPGNNAVYLYAPQLRSIFQNTIPLLRKYDTANPNLIADVKAYLTSPTSAASMLQGKSKSDRKNLVEMVTNYQLIRGLIRLFSLDPMLAFSSLKEVSCMCFHIGMETTLTHI